MKSKTKLVNYILGLFLVITGLVLVGQYSNYYVAFGLFLWTWGNNIDTNLKTQAMSEYSAYLKK